MIKTEIKKFLKKAITDDIEVEIVIPEQEQFGHYSTNIAMRLAKIKGKNPVVIAKTIVDFLQKKAPKGFFEKIEVVDPGFINFWIAPKTFQKELVKIIKAKNKWGKQEKGSKKTIIIDYCGINIAKPMSVGHLRSTIIGQSLYNIYKFNNWKVISDNHLGDWGKQFGVLIAAYKEEMAFEKLGINKKNLEIDDLMKLYVDYTNRIKKDPGLEEKAREEVKKLQEGDRENTKIWKKFQKITFHELQKIFKMLEIKMDYHLGESFYNPMLGAVVRDALNKKVAVKSDGAVVIFTDKEKAPFIIQKSDGAYLYATTDIATIKYRIEKFKPAAIVYITGNEQSLHFEQLFKAVKSLGIIKNETLMHVKFGLILSEDMKKLSTREGKHISLEHLLNESIVRAKKIIDEKQPKLNKKRKTEIAKVIGIGAIKYNDLSQNRQSDIAFNWDRMLNFEGNSAPYLLYSYARLRSILRKAKLGKYDPKYLNEKIELKLINDLEEFPDILQRIINNYYPHILAEYLYKLAGDANSFYHSLPVLNAEKGVKESRLALIKVVSEVLKTGLNLLGIETVEQM